MQRNSYILRRLAFVPFAALIVVTLSFLLVNAIPSDPAQLQAGPAANDETIARINHQLGLDESLWTRYWDWISDLVTTGSLGESYFSKRSVWSDIGLYIGSSLELVFLAMTVAVVLGVGMGALGAYFQGRAVDRVTGAFVTVIQVVPDFLLGLVGVYVLFFQLGWLPSPTGQLGLLDAKPDRVTGAVLFDVIITGQWSLLGSAISHAILPVLTLGISFSAMFAKITRNVLERSLGSFQVEYARACGLSRWKVFVYAFSAARTQILTYAGLLFAALLGGSAIVEQLFSWNGLGQFAVKRILQLDLPEMQGIILVLAAITLIVILVIDLLVALLDPRVSYE
jgi:peptide/nickel transport system permease protein